MNIRMVTWFLFVITLIGTVLNIFHMKEGFYFWSISNALWAVVGYKRKDYAQLAMFLTMLLVSLWGILAWK